MFLELLLLFTETLDRRFTLPELQPELLVLLFQEQDPLPGGSMESRLVPEVLKTPPDLPFGQCGATRHRVVV